MIFFLGMFLYYIINDLNLSINVHNEHEYPKSFTQNHQIKSDGKNYSTLNRTAIHVEQSYVRCLFQFKLKRKTFCEKTIIPIYTVNTHTFNNEL